MVDQPTPEDGRWQRPRPRDRLYPEALGGLGTLCLPRGDVPIDNSPVENAIRPVTLGRRNWLFTGSERAGRRAAAIQGLLATAALNGIEPYAWLKDTLEKLPTGRIPKSTNCSRSNTPLSNLGFLQDGLAGRLRS